MLSILPSVFVRYAKVANSELRLSIGERLQKVMWLKAGEGFVIEVSHSAERCSVQLCSLWPIGESERRAGPIDYAA